MSSLMQSIRNGWRCIGCEFQQPLVHDLDHAQSAIVYRSLKFIWNLSQLLATKAVFPDLCPNFITCKIFIQLASLLQLFQFVLSLSLPPSLASTIETCSRNLPRPEECIIRSVDKLRSALAIGDLGEGFKTPPLEPLHIDNIDMRRGNEFNAVFSNLYVNGPSKFVVEKLK